MLPTCHAQIENIRMVYPNALFVVERNIDSNIVIYEAERKGNVLCGVRCFWSKWDNLAEKVEVSDKAKDMFYGVKLKQISRALWKMSVTCIPDHIVDLHLKKSGAVVPKLVLNTKMCKLHSIFCDLVKMPPEVKGLYVYGDHKGEAEHENIAITDAMRSRVNIGSFVSSFAF